MPKKQTQKEFIEKSKKIFGDQLDYSKVNYINSITEVILTCKKHGDFSIAPKDHICYERGCGVCSGAKYNLQTLLEAMELIHGDMFDYSKVTFTNVKIPVIIICKIHGEFLQTPDKHLQGQGCPKCKKSARKDLDYFLITANEIHGNKYDYSKVIFTRMFDNVEIICSKHGSFWQTPANHINNKQGCSKCATENTRILLDDFILRSLLSHDITYNYSKTIYINGATKVEIICPKHGSFWQFPFQHINGANCPWCTGKISVQEQLWLDSINVPNEYRNKTIYIGEKRYCVDAYDPITNTIYEFYGDYWHGNPQIYKSEYINKHNKQKFSVLYDKTIKRQNELIEAGYKIVFIWERDFKKVG